MYIYVCVCVCIHTQTHTHTPETNVLPKMSTVTLSVLFKLFFFFFFGGFRFLKKIDREVQEFSIYPLPMSSF